MAAPVCHVSKDQVISQPDPKQMPSIPHATDLASALLAIAALKKIVEHIVLPPKNNGHGTVLPPPAKIGRWTQFNRVTERVKVTNPDDPSQFVEIDRIKTLTMVDNVTGEKWVWNR